MRRRRLLSFVWIAALAPLSFACTCARLHSACGGLTSAVVFVGTVEGDTGGILGTRRARVAVEEVLNGLPRSARRVEIDTAIGSSCYLQLNLGERYVIYASPDRTRPDLLRTGRCSHTFLVKGNEHLLDALRNAVSQGPTMLVGMIHPKESQYRSSEMGIPGAAVAVEKEGRRFAAVTDVDGKYVIRNLPAGDYTIRASAKDYLADGDKGKPVHIPTSGCEIADVDLWTNGRISGSVRDESGSAVQGIVVQAFHLPDLSGIESSPELKAALAGSDPAAQAEFQAQLRRMLQVSKSLRRVDSTPVKTAVSDAHGRYIIQGLPPGEYVIGANADRYEDREPYPPSVYPQGSDLDKGEQISLGRAEERSGINLTIGARRVEALVRVQAFMPDGSAMPNKRSWIKALNTAMVERASSDKIDADGRGTLGLRQGETYIIEASCFISESFTAADGVQRQRSVDFTGRSEPIRLSEPETAIRIVLQRKERQLMSPSR